MRISHERARPYPFLDRCGTLSPPVPCSRCRAFTQLDRTVLHVHRTAREFIDAKGWRMTSLAPRNGAPLRDVPVLPSS